MSLAQLGGPAACTLLDSAQFTCPSLGLSTATIDLGNADDQVNDSNTSLATTVTAGRGQKEIKTGAGNDLIQVRNGSIDRIDCGAGDDTVVADAQDPVASNCEHVDRSAAVTTPIAPTSGSHDGTGGGLLGSGGGSDDGQTGSDGTSSGNSTGSSGSDDGAETVFQTPLGLTLPGTTVHFRGEPAGGVEDLIAAVDPIEPHLTGNRVDRVMATDIFDKVKDVAFGGSPPSGQQDARRGCTRSLPRPAACTRAPDRAAQVPAGGRRVGQAAGPDRLPRPFRARIEAQAQPGSDEGRRARRLGQGRRHPDQGRDAQGT